MKIRFNMRMKIMLLCLGCTLLALVLQSSFYQRASSSIIYEQAKTENLTRLETMQTEILELVNKIEQSLINIYTEREFIDDIKSGMPYDELRERYYTIAYQYGATNFTLDEGLQVLYIYDKEHRLISSYRKDAAFRDLYATDIYGTDEDYNAQVVRDYAESDKHAMLISGYYNTRRQTEIVRFVIKLYAVNDFKNELGYAIADIDSRQIRRIIQKYYSASDNFLWLQPKGEPPVLKFGTLTDKEIASYNAAVKETIQGNNSNAALNIEGRVFFQAPQKKYDLQAFLLMPQETLIANQKRLTSLLFLTSLVMISITALFSALVSHSLMQPLESMMTTIKRIRQGETKMRVKVSHEDEIGQLGQSFNELLDEVDSLISKQYQTELLLNKAEYKALQAQINPHFLYNTLDTMSSIAAISNCPTVSNLSQSLSNIFRYSLDMKNQLTSIAHEIVHLKNFMYVMNVRTQNDIQLEFDISDEISQCLVPKISIQPIVENAIVHGLRNKHGEKKIRVSSFEEGDDLIISVEDNGIGMDPTEINLQLENSNLALVERGNSIGLLNINARARMLFGNHYGITISSEPDKGTTVFLRIPRRFNGGIT